MPGNNEDTLQVQVLTHLYGADEMNNFSVFQVSQRDNMQKTSSLTAHQTYKNVERE
jgi:hypothetical protein